MAVFDKFSGINVASGFKAQIKAPLDPRLVVDSIADRDALIDENGAYDGMKVYDKSTKTTWMLKDSSTREWVAESSREELEQLQYYGDKDIVPNPQSDFEFSAVNNSDAVDVKFVGADTITKVVFPYKYLDDNKKEHPINACLMTNNTNVKEVILPNGITYIHFFGSTGLETIKVPKSVYMFESDAFNGCTNLKEIAISGYIINIMSYAFKDCISLTHIDIPLNDIDEDTYTESAITIESQAFNGCTNLKTLSLLTNVTAEFVESYYGLIPIVDDAFENCPNITIICNQGSYIDTYVKENNIPYMYEVVKPEIGDLTALETIEKTTVVGAINEVNAKTEEELERLQYYGDKDIIPSDASYFTVNETGETITGLTDTGKTQTELVIPYKINDVEITTLDSGLNDTSILDGNSVITKVVISNNITSIGDYAFNLCRSLKSINIPNSVTSIGDYAFKGCVSLKSINIPNSVTSIGSVAFENCSSLTSINIPNSVTNIGNTAFGYCSSLTSINISNSVTSIGAYVFVDCSSLTSINIPNNVTSIGAYAFVDCTSLTSINIPSSVIDIDETAFQGCIDFTIYCSQGSYAETYAKGNNIPYRYTEVEPVVGDLSDLETTDKSSVVGAINEVNNKISVVTTGAHTLTGSETTGTIQFVTGDSIEIKMDGVVPEPELPSPVDDPVVY